MLVAETYQRLGVVCPHCHSPLAFEQEAIACTTCKARFSYEEGFPDLIVGNRFDDGINDERNAYEEESYSYTAENYFLPLFRSLLGDPRQTRQSPRILSVGCGNGADVDALAEAGFESTGIECGMRCSNWKHRKHPGRLLLANGMTLPFESGTFDLVYCGCVFPHVGTIGESHKVRPEYQEEREALAREMSRVLRPGGKVLTCSPNRHCPVDLFHGRSATNPFPRLNMPGDPFLLSAADYGRIFGHFGCNQPELLPIEGYWGFVRRKKSFKGRLIMAPVSGLFRLVSLPAFRALRNTPLSPWISVLMHKQKG